MVRVHNGIYDLSREVSKYNEIFKQNPEEAKPYGKRILERLCIKKTDYQIPKEIDWEEQIKVGESLNHTLEGLIGKKLAQTTKSGFSRLAEQVLGYENQRDFRTGDECRYLGNILLQEQLLSTAANIVQTVVRNKNE